MAMVKIIGLDLSLSRTGLARPDGTTSSFRPKGGADNPAHRLHELRDRIGATLLAIRPHLAVLEGYQTNAQHAGGRGSETTTIRLAELGGAIRVELYANGVRYVEVHPSTLKAWAGLVLGHQVKSKDDMVSAALTLGGHPDNDDQADAFLLRCIGIQRYEPNPDWPDMTAKIAGLPWPELRAAHA
jgi:Holliday junction resolvasome RuvABC endonuclease subunit